MFDAGKEGQPFVLGLAVVSFILTSTSFHKVITSHLCAIDSKRKLIQLLKLTIKMIFVRLFETVRLQVFKK